MSFKKVDECMCQVVWSYASNVKRKDKKHLHVQKQLACITLKKQTLEYFVYKNWSKDTWEIE